ncbi:WGR domain-containing protein [Streptosporangium sp. NPDC000396]|uniref:WGR domain-containing protein n=1 Tax=Streptosporangium sp. NPDC000396 TaxID=3366185 RepID=UPI0036991F44
MDEHDPISRFYGLPITPETAAASVEQLTDPFADDLVKAHLGSNYSYFGAIDKTLAGFFVLDDEGDNYTLLDVRGDGRVWWQDHETRELYLHFDSLDDWRAFKEEVDKGCDENELRDAFRTKERPAARPGEAPGTPALATRYQWLVWLLSQPLRNHQGRVIQDDDELTRSAIGRFRAIWPTDEAAEKSLLAELPLLAGDPHLAIYWLLHTSLLAMEPQRARVLAAIGQAPCRTPLVDAFAAAFGSLPLDGDVTIVPGFRTRRSLALLYTGDDAPEAEQARTALVSMEIEPRAKSLMKFVLVRDGLEGGTLTDAEVAAAATRMDAAPGSAALRALLDQRAGMEASPHADEFARTATTTGETWPWVLATLWQVHSLVRDLDALETVIGFLLDKDPYHRRVLAILQHAQELAGREFLMPADELERAWALAEASAPILQELATPDDHSAIISRIADPALARAVARRVLHRADVDEYAAEVSSWAIRAVLAGDDPDRGELAARGFEALPFQSHQQVLADIAGEITSPGHPLVRVMLRVLEHAAEPDDADSMATYTAKQMKKEVLTALAPFAHEPEIFDELMRLAELPAGHTTIDSLWSQLFNPFSEETYVLPRLSDEQAVRVARAMIATQLTHPVILARNTAGHQLYRFAHAGAEDFLIEALNEYGRRFADSVEKGGKVFDRGETEDDLLKDLVANLYSAVGNMGTPRSRTALIERLFTERREFWRMGNAIGGVFSAEVHREALAMVRERRDGMGAGCYAYALADFVKQGPPKVDLLQELAGWPVPVEELSRRFFKYALMVGIEAALTAKAYDLVRAAHALASSIAEPPLQPDEHARARRWDNPLETEELAGQLEAVLSGAADDKRRRLVEKGVAARLQGTPRLKISDKKLGILAGTTVRRRLLHDRTTGEIWFLDVDGVARAFDGYEITGLPFEPRAIGYGRMRAFLDGVTELSERALFWDRRAHEFVEVIRYGDRLTYVWGQNNCSLDGLGLSFPGVDAAANAFARVKSSVAAAGMTETSPWYVPGKGAILRTFRTPDPDGPNNSSDYRRVFDRRINGGPRFATEAEAVAAQERWELEAQRDHDAGLTCLEWQDDRLRPEDMTVREWIRDRIRDDPSDAAWHARALTEIVDYLRSHGYGDLIGSIEVEVGSGVSDDEIAAYEAERRHPIPEVLRAFWREIGHARWSVGGVGTRVLSPSQVLSRRPAARQLGEDFLRRLAPAEADAARPLMSALDVLVETLDGSGIFTVLADREAEDGRVFTHADYDPRSFWWEKSLSWMLATRFLDLFADAIEEAAPVVAQLNHGQRLNPDAQRRYFELREQGKTPRFWELLYDETLGLVSTRSGKVGAAGAVRNRRYDDPARAAHKAAKLVAAKEKDGYREAVPGKTRADTP